MNEAQRSEESDLDRLVSRIMANRNMAHKNSMYSECDDIQYQIERDHDTDDWYIQVNPVDHGFLYDGWWRDSGDATMRDAVEEAVRGAMILDG